MDNTFFKKEKLTLKEMYSFLLNGCLEFKEANRKGFIDEDKENRRCNKYAVLHTVKCWRAQWQH